MSEQSYRGSDFVKVKVDQVGKGIRTYDADAEAKAIPDTARSPDGDRLPYPLAAYPNTTPGYADAVFGFWKSAAEQSIGYLQNEGTQFDGPLVKQTARAYWSAAKALEQGAKSERALPNGLHVFDPSSCRQFWDAVTQIALCCESSKATITSSERWSTFWDGAAEAANNLAHGIGAAAGAVAREAAKVAGDVVGSILHGIVDGLGIVGVALVATGAVVYWKVSHP